MDWEEVRKAEQDALYADVKWERSAETLISITNDEIANLLTRWKIWKTENRERLFRKLVEELGEYCEAIEFENGSTNKVEKFKDITPDEKLEEEICDVIMMSLALARYEGLNIEKVLENIHNKLEKYSKGNK